MSKLMLPAPDELVITVLGGSSQGESVVVHIGDNHWIVVDSYLSNKQSLPYQYLTSIGADLNNVEMVICTHWHSDHVKGMFQILSSCPNATFYVPGVTESKYYPEFFAGNLLETECSTEAAFTVMQEFNECMKYAIEKDKLDYLERDKTLVRRDIHGQHLEISTISPSKGMKTRFNKMFASKKDGKYKEYGIEPNMCSSAIVISLNDDLHLLLGSDLESNRPDEDHDLANCSIQCEKRSMFGWCNSFLESQVHNYVSKYDYVKISHHSSETGYCPKLWTEKVTDEVVGVTTVFHANLLPQPDMMDIYAQKCKEYYISAPPIAVVSSIEHDEINNLMEDGVVKAVSVATGEYGSVSSKYSFSSLKYLGTILDGTAFKFNNGK